jgi:GT2 family glycosyltransferase
MASFRGNVNGSGCVGKVESDYGNGCEGTLAGERGNYVNYDKPTDAEVVVIMLTVNQRDVTLRALASLSAIQAPRFQVLLWDNGSDDGTSDAVREIFPEVIVRHHPTNLGAAAGRNAAAKLAIEKFSPVYLLFIDNDMTVAPDCLSALLKPFENDSRLAQTTGKILVPGGNGRLNDAGGCKIQFWLGRTQPVGHGEIDYGQYDRPTRCIPGGFTLVRTSVFQQVGGFDALFDPYGYEDLDFSLRISTAGYYALYVPQAVAYHDVSQTFEAGKYTKRYVSHKARNWFLFMRRHASVGEQLAFVFLGAPYRLIRAAIREGKQGNLSALIGVLRGTLDVLKTKRTAKN